LSISVETDWLELWRELAISDPYATNGEPTKRYIEHVKNRRERPDPLLNFLLKEIDSCATVLDIGAGNGRWTIPMAKIAQGVTAVEPSDAMQKVLRENLKADGLNNVRTIQSTWEEAVVEPHDFVVCAHAMYSIVDFSSFIRKMEQSAKKGCYLAIRFPPADGIIGELSHSIHGRYHDSPNAIIAYNALYSLGIYANLLVENNIYRWVNTTFKDAFARAKRHLHLESSTNYDKLIKDTLYRRLIPSDDSLVWPDGMRSALLWWHPSSDSNKLSEHIVPDFQSFKRNGHNT